MRRHVIYSTNFSYESAAEAIARRLTPDPEERAKTKEDMQKYLKSLPRAQLKSTLRLLGVSAMDLAEKHRRQLVKRAEAAGTDTNIPDLAVNVLDMASPYMLKHAQEDIKNLGEDTVDKVVSSDPKSLGFLERMRKKFFPSKTDRNVDNMQSILTAAYRSVDPDYLHKDMKSTPEKHLTPETNNAILSMIKKPRSYTNNTEVTISAGVDDYYSKMKEYAKKVAFAEVSKDPNFDKKLDTFLLPNVAGSDAVTLDFPKIKKSHIFLDLSRTSPDSGIHELHHARDAAHNKIKPGRDLEQELRANRVVRSVGSYLPKSQAKDRAIIHNNATYSDNSYVLGGHLDHNISIPLVLSGIKPEDLEALQALRQKHDRGFRA